MLPGHRSRRSRHNTNSMPRKTNDLASYYKTQRLPRSADPSPQRTIERIESLGERHGVISNPDFNFEHFQNRMALHKRAGSIPAIHQSGYSFHPAEPGSGPPHHHHQVLYVCRGHCSGPRCDFSESLREWQSTVWVNKNAAETPGVFQSEVVASAPKALEKLDQKRQSLDKLKDVLAQKLGDKHKKRKAKELQKQRSASAIMFERPETAASMYVNNRDMRERSSSAMMVRRPESRQSVQLEKMEEEKRAREEENTKIAREMARQQRRRNNSQSKKEELMKTKIPQNILELTAQDLLAKSHEELVLLLIHLRRQGATLSEAIDGSRAELENITNTIVTSSDDRDSLDNKRILDDLHLHVKELEERRAKVQPIINLVDNMVKLGSLYRGPSDAPMSHRIRNLPSSSNKSSCISNSTSATAAATSVPQDLKDEIQELIQRSKDVRHKVGQNTSRIPEHQTILEGDLARTHQKMRQAEMQLEEIASQQAQWEHEMLMLRQNLQASASRDMKFGIHQSVETLHIEAELAHVQQKASKLTTKRSELILEMQKCAAKSDWATGNNSYGDAASSSSDSMTKKQQPPKTVRMVKRDSKDRIKLPSDEPGAPPTLPRGNSHNVHDFLQSAAGDLEEDPEDGLVMKASTLPRSFRSEDLKDLRNSGPVYSSLIKPSMIHGNKYITKRKQDERPGSSLSAHERLFGSGASTPDSPAGKIGIKNPMMSPIFKSDTARAIAKEVGLNGAELSRVNKQAKKRSLTISGSNPSSVIEALNNHHAKELMGNGRSCDDLDLDQALKSDGLSTPDVIKSALDHKSEGPKISETTIDRLFGVPDKIVIPERYIPDTDMDNQTPEERQVRLKKADSIRRMLAEQSTVQGGRDDEDGDAEKKQREHLLALNQVIARQVMEKSRMVAVYALANRKFPGDEDYENETELYDLTKALQTPLESPPEPLPLYQKRDNLLQ